MMNNALSDKIKRIFVFVAARGWSVQYLNKCWQNNNAAALPAQ